MRHEVTMKRLLEILTLINVSPHPVISREEAESMAAELCDARHALRVLRRENRQMTEQLEAIQQPQFDLTAGN